MTERRFKTAIGGNWKWPLLITAARAREEIFESIEEYTECYYYAHGGTIHMMNVSTLNVNIVIQILTTISQESGVYIVPYKHSWGDFH